MALARGEPDVAWLESTGLPELTDGIVRETLGIIFTTEVRRAAAIVEPLPGTLIGVCVDEGAVVAGTRREAVCELELELKQGKLSALFGLATQLVTHADIRVDTVSKAQRGYRLARREHPAPMKTSKVDLSRKANVDQLFGTLAFACLTQLQGNEYGLLHSRELEYLHQARIALRRLRSVFSVFSSAVPRAHFSEQLLWLRETSRTLGGARNWDVFMTQFWPRACAGIADHSAIASLTRAAARLRAKARRRARNTLSSSEYSAGILDLTRELLEQGWITARTVDQRAIAERPPKMLARSVLHRAHRRLIKHGERLDREHDEAIHQLRIRIKKLRYAAELLAPLMRGKAKHKYLSRLGALQEILGNLNDAANAGRLLERLATTRNDSATKEAIAYLKGYGEALSRTSLSGFDTAWKRFAETKPFW